ncbi:MAG: ABC transporter ATP-binding protein, partial [Succinivibrionaceae bacterium]|nr:ABC transporter ATP-binding protein [Succinivibrionaceae bacterium]
GLSFTERHELDHLPARIEEVERELAAVDEELSRPEAYAREGGVGELTARRGEVESRLEALMARWEELESRAEASP